MKCCVVKTFANVSIYKPSFFLSPQQRERPIRFLILQTCLFPRVLSAIPSVENVLAPSSPNARRPAAVADRAFGLGSASRPLRSRSFVPHPATPLPRLQASASASRKLVPLRVPTVGLYAWLRLLASRSIRLPGPLRSLCLAEPSPCSRRNLLRCASVLAKASLQAQPRPSSSATPASAYGPSSQRQGGAALRPSPSEPVTAAHRVPANA